MFHLAASTDNVGVASYHDRAVCRGRAASGFAAGTVSGKHPPFTTSRYYPFLQPESTGAGDRFAGNTAAIPISYRSCAADKTPDGPEHRRHDVPDNTQINLPGRLPDDGRGVSGYLLERCQGAACSTLPIVLLW